MYYLVDVIMSVEVWVLWVPFSALALFFWEYLRGLFMTLSLLHPPDGESCTVTTHVSSPKKLLHL